MILLISGSRSIDDTEIFKRALHEFMVQQFAGEYPLPLNKTISQIVSGNARGVDSTAERVAKKQGIDLAIFPANWERDGRSAGPIRNEAMMNYGILISQHRDEELRLLAIPYPDAVGGGTNHMINICTNKGIPTFTYDASKHSRWPKIQLENSRKAEQGQ